MGKAEAQAEAVAEGIRIGRAEKPGSDFLDCRLAYSEKVCTALQREHDFLGIPARTTMGALFSEMEADNPARTTMGALFSGKSCRNSNGSFVFGGILRNPKEP